MRTKISYLCTLISIGLLIIFFMPGQSTLGQPATVSLSFDSVESIGCDEWGTTVMLSVDPGGQEYRMGDRVVVNSVVYMDHFEPASTTPYTGGLWSIAYLNSEGGAVSPNPWPIPNDTPFTWYTIVEQPPGVHAKTLILEFDKCNGGSLLSATILPDSSATAETTAPDGDPDRDGIPSKRDNCPYDYNPDQEDGWGSLMGDACDTEWYNRTGQGVAGFLQKNGMFHLHGNCLYLVDGAPRCPVIAAFDPTTFDPANMPMAITTVDAGTWSVWLYYLHSENGADVSQVNTYSTNPPQPDTLVDDQLEIHVEGGRWQWQHRGGHGNYHGG